MGSTAWTSRLSDWLPATMPTQALEAYRNRGISTVDDIDLTAGRLALALLLAGAQPGHYGFGESATDGSVPPIEPAAGRG